MIDEIFIKFMRISTAYPASPWLRTRRLDLVHFRIFFIFLFFQILFLLRISTNETSTIQPFYFIFLFKISSFSYFSFNEKLLKEKLVFLEMKWDVEDDEK